MSKKDLAKKKKKYAALKLLQTANRERWGCCPDALGSSALKPHLPLTSPGPLPKDQSQHSPRPPGNLSPGTQSGCRRNAAVGPQPALTSSFAPDEPQIRDFKSREMPAHPRRPGRRGEIWAPPPLRALPPLQRPEASRSRGTTLLEAGSAVVN